MDSTTFNPKPGRGGTIAATANCPLRKRQLVGDVHDGNAYALGGVSGNAGLFSTVTDVARFCRNITFSGERAQDLPFGPAAIRLIFSNALPESIGGQTLGGWFTYPNDMLPGGDFVSKAAIGHSGFTGTAIIIDPPQDLAAVFLTNRVCRDDDGTRFRHLRRRIFNAAVASIVC